jgi:crossover junction endodeoxyribonuclease RusA
MLILELPWPSRDLHPNSRVHWARRARAAKRAREDAGWTARAAGFRRIEANSVSVTAIFIPPDNRRRDSDGMLSSIKNYLDGISDVIGVDDSLWNIAIRREAPRKPGAVRIEIEVTAGRAAA